MTMQYDLNWYTVQVRENKKETPKERWGHRLFKVKSQLFLFGGFGGMPEGQGKYLDDLWKFSLLSATWQAVETTGQHPQPRSNYTINFDQINNQIILFGGGSTRKVRYNTIFILNLANMHWRKITPPQNLEAPWERTYHTSQFLYPYIVVFGGEGVSYIDLNDTWVFDVRNQKWTQIFPKGKAPAQRRFASSSLIGMDFYLIGGCQGNYNLVGDIHRLSLQPLLQNRLEELRWQCLVENNKLLQRWGHSCDSFNGKLYMFAGRISHTTDNTDFIEYDPIKNKLQKLQTGRLVPKARRRHASVMVSNNLLCFGGYDGCYLKDFSYLKIQDQTKKSQLTIQKVKNTKELIKQLYKLEENMDSYAEIEIKIKDKSTFLCTNALKLKQNAFFSCLAKHQGLSLELPSFCSFTMFRIINAAITKRIMLINEAEGLQYYSNMAESLSYFSCIQEIKEFEKFLISLLNEYNAVSMLQLSVNAQLVHLNEVAAIAYLTKRPYIQTKTQASNQFVLEQELLKHSKQKGQIQVSNQSICHRINLSLISTYQKYAFEIEQQKLKRSKQGLKSKAKSFVKGLFSSKKTQKQDEDRHWQIKKQKRQRKSILSYFEGIWIF